MPPIISMTTKPSAPVPRAMTEATPARSIFREGASFLVMGGLNTAVCLALYQLLLLAMDYRIAFTLVFAFGIAFSALLYSRFVYKVSVAPKTFGLYAAFYVMSYLFGLGVLALLVEYAGIQDRLAIFAQLAISTPVNFVGSRVILRR